MATRIYTRVSTDVGVTPTDWEFGVQVSPVTVRGTTVKNDGSTITTEGPAATGTTSPTTAAMGRTVIGPLSAQTIAGTVKGQMLCCESNAGANATLAIAIKIVQPNGNDRGVLLAPIASDLTTSTPPEMAVSSTGSTRTNRRHQNAAESAAITLTSQTATAGDYLVIEWGFRSATTTTRNIYIDYGNSSATDAGENDTDTSASPVNPWWEFSQTLNFLNHGAVVGSSGAKAGGVGAYLRHAKKVATSGVLLAGLATLAPHHHYAVAGTNGVRASGVATVTPHSAGGGVSIDPLVDLISYWSLDEASGDALDAHGTNDLVETSGTIGATTGLVGGARDIQVGDTESFTHADNADFSLGSDTPFTWVMWTKADQSLQNSGARLLTKIDGDSESGINYEYQLVHGTGGNFQMLVSNGVGTGVCNHSGTLYSAPTDWHFIVAWHDPDANQLLIQVDNDTPGTGAWSGGTLDGTGTVFLGSDINANYYDGLLDEVAFFKRVLTDDERTWLYNSGAGRAYSELAEAGGGNTASIVGSGGVHVSGIATLAQHHHYAVVGSSGVLASGLATRLAHAKMVGASGVRTNGIATTAVKRHYAVVGTSGVRASGVVAYLRHAKKVATSGALISGVATIHTSGVQHQAIVGTSGIRASGTAIRLAHAKAIGTNGVRTGGMAARAAHHHYAIVGSSGARASGTATIAPKHHYAVVATSGVRTSGVAALAVHRHRAIVASSGIRTSGTATRVAKYHPAVVGTSGVLASGLATKHAKTKLVATSGVRLSGLATIHTSGVQHYAIVAAGGLRVTGTAPQHTHRSVVATSGARISGTATRVGHHHTAIVGTNGVRASGLATKHVKVKVASTSGARISGVPTLRRHTSKVGASGVRTSGAVIYLRHCHPIGSGGIRASGHLAYRQDGSVIATGLGASVGGQALIIRHQGAGFPAILTSTLVPLLNNTMGLPAVHSVRVLLPVYALKEVA